MFCDPWWWWWRTGSWLLKHLFGPSPRREVDSINMWPKKLWKYFPFENHNSLVLNSSSSKKKWFFKCSFKNKYQISFCINMLLISSNIMPCVAPRVPRIDLHYLLVCRRQMWPGGKARNVFSSLHDYTSFIGTCIHQHMNMGWLQNKEKLTKFDKYKIYQ